MTRLLVSETSTSFAVSFVLGFSALNTLASFCVDKSVDPLVITGLTLSPDPPKEGKPLTITVSYTLSKCCTRTFTPPYVVSLLVFSAAAEKVTGGMIKVDAELDNVPLYNGSVDLCDLLVQVGEKCPIDPMSARNTTTVSIPVVHVRKTA